MYYNFDPIATDLQYPERPQSLRIDYPVCIYSYTGIFSNPGIKQYPSQISIWLLLHNLFSAGMRCIGKCVGSESVVTRVLEQQVVFIIVVIAYLCTCIQLYKVSIFAHFFMYNGDISIDRINRI